VGVVPAEICVHTTFSAAGADVRTSSWLGAGRQADRQAGGGVRYLLVADKILPHPLLHNRVAGQPVPKAVQLHPAH
jgi:hypothetical protein